MESKQALFHKFITMTKESWTYARLTEEERKRLLDVLSTEFSLYRSDNNRVNRLSDDTYWRILNISYRCYLQGIGYTDFNWREEDN